MHSQSLVVVIFIIIAFAIVLLAAYAIMSVLASKLISCKGIAPYSCATPTLSQSGAVNATVDGFTEAETVLGIACTRTATAPETFTQTSKGVNPSAALLLSFDCKVPLNSTGVSTYYLWIKDVRTGMSSPSVTNIAVVIINESSGK